MTKLAVLVSGHGSNLEAIIQYPLHVSLVVADRECRALDVARRARISTALVRRSPKEEFDRSNFTSGVLGTLIAHDIEVVAMAGFMTIFSAFIFNRYRGRFLNTHPSLLPEFKGPHAVRDALIAGVPKTGCTVHVATPRVDTGRILAQQEVSIYSGDTENMLRDRIKEVERVLYPKTIENFLRQISGRT